MPRARKTKLVLHQEPQEDELDMITEGITWRRTAGKNMKTVFHCLKENCKYQSYKHKELDQHRKAVHGWPSVPELPKGIAPKSGVKSDAYSKKKVVREAQKQKNPALFAWNTRFDSWKRRARNTLRYRWKLKKICKEKELGYVRKRLTRYVNRYKKKYPPPPPGSTEIPEKRKTGRPNKGEPPECMSPETSEDEDNKIEYATPTNRRKKAMVVSEDDDDYDDDETNTDVDDDEDSSTDVDNNVNHDEDNSTDVDNDVDSNTDSMDTRTDDVDGCSDDVDESSDDDRFLTTYPSADAPTLKCFTRRKNTNCSDDELDTLDTRKRKHYEYNHGLETKKMKQEVTLKYFVRSKTPEDEDGKVVDIPVHDGNMLFLLKPKKQKWKNMNDLLLETKVVKNKRRTK